MLLLALLILVLILAAVCGLSCRAPEEELPQDPCRLLSFEYIYSDFRYRPQSFSLRRAIGEGGEPCAFFKAEGYHAGIFNLEEAMESSVLDELAAILKEEAIFAWDGFDQRNTEVRDGFSFSLVAEFENRRIRARGYVNRPENFQKGHDRLSRYLLDLALGSEADGD